MYPICFEPIYQNYVWGGEKIAEKYLRPISGRAAESWELSDRDEAMSVVSNGKYKGRTLSSLVQELGEELLGLGRAGDRFPLLLKIIDAKEPLSIQVHPDEVAAKDKGVEPKSEMWVALEPGSVYAGLKKGTTREQFAKAIKSKKAEKLLEKVDLHRTDAVFIPGGRIHSVCGGSFLYEIQQNSNTTYRLYDWGRDRELHLDEGLSAVYWDNQKGAKATPHHLESDLHHQLILLVDSPHFTVMRADVFDTWHVPATNQSFHIFFCMEGKGSIRTPLAAEPLQAGRTYLIPAFAGPIQIDGQSEVLWIRQR